MGGPGRRETRREARENPLAGVPAHVSPSARGGLLENTAGVNPARVFASLQIVALCVGVYWWINYMHAHLIWQPALVLTLPPVGIGAIALALPLLSYVSFQDDYRGMAPWSPRGFFAICRKTYGSMDARGRVSQKNL